MIAGKGPAGGGGTGIAERFPVTAVSALVPQPPGWAGQEKAADFSLGLALT